jgi:hypothetical protein
VPAVEEGQEELGFLVVVGGDGAPVVLALPAQQGRREPAEPRDRVEVGEELAHLQRRHHVTVDVEPPFQVRDGDLELVERRECLGAQLLLDGDDERGFGRPEGVGGTGEGLYGEGHRGAGFEVRPVALVQGADEVGGGHGDNVSPGRQIASPGWVIVICSI